jgi:hypothetical protein
MAPQPKANLLCPLCGAANGCAPARSGRFDEPCWCQAASFPAALLARVPEPLRDVACVCAACAASAAESATAPR